MKLAILTILPFLGAVAVPIGRHLRSVLFARTDIASPKGRLQKAVQTRLGFYGSRILRKRWLSWYCLPQYCKVLARQHVSMAIPGRSIDILVDKCFVPLDVMDGNTAKRVKVAEETGSILLLGDPGAGKSALVSRVIRSLCNSARQHAKSSKLPIYVELPVLQAKIDAGGAGTSPKEAFEFLQGWFHETSLEPLGLMDTEQMVSTFAQGEANGVVVFFDGLDEVDQEILSKMVAFIIATSSYLSQCAAENPVVICSRPQVLDDPALQKYGELHSMRHLELAPFSPAAVHSFLMRWPHDRHLDANEEAARLFSNLSANPAMFDTCRNPLALSLYVLLDAKVQADGHERGEGLPETRASFYGEITNHLLVRRSAARTGRPVRSRAVRNQWSGFLSQVAYDHILSKDQYNYIPHETLIKYSDGLTNVDGDRDRAIEQMATNTGLIRRNAHDTWSFIHRSYLDYFVGYEIANQTNTRGDIRSLGNSLKADPLRRLEAFYFACGVLADRQPTLLSQMLKYISNNAWLASSYPRACVEGQRFLDPEFTTVVRNLLGSYLTEKSAQRMSDSDQLLKDIIRSVNEYEEVMVDTRQNPLITLTEVSRKLKKSGIQEEVDATQWPRISSRAQLAAVVESSSSESLLLTFHDPRAIATALDEGKLPTGRLAAVLAEGALRSALVSSTLKSRRSEESRRPRSRKGRGWGSSWSVRGTALGWVLDEGAMFLKASTSAGDVQAFPHLASLQFTRPTHRLRAEMIWGSPRAITMWSSFALSVGLLGSALSGLVWLGVVIAAVSVVVVLEALRLLVLRKVVQLHSQVILNVGRMPSDLYIETFPELVFARGFHKEFRAFSPGRPPRGLGPDRCIYYRSMPLIWRRFSPALGDERIGLRDAACLRSVWTAELAEVI